MTLEEAVKSDLDKLLEEWKKYIFLLGYETAKKEIVYCKDCKHRPTQTEPDEGNGFSVEFPDERCPCRCEDGWYNWMPKDDWFCGNGERKEE